MAVPLSRHVAFWTLAVVGCLTDLATKGWAFDRLGMPGERILWIWPEYFGLQTSLNEGALFGLGQGKVPIFVGLSCVALVGLCYWLFVKGAARDWLLTVALGAVTAGILGNLYDRLGIHQLVWNHPPVRIGEPVYAVRDWILFQANEEWRWPNFNLADSFLVCGAAILAWQAFWQKEPAENHASVGKIANNEPGT